MSNSKIYLGSTNLGTGKIRLGANDVSAIYLGANLVYPTSTPPTPTPTPTLVDYVHTSTASLTANYIDTGIYPTTDTVFRIVFKPNNTIGNCIVGYDFTGAPSSQKSTPTGASSDDTDYRLINYSTRNKMHFDFNNSRIEKTMSTDSDGYIDITCGNNYITDNIAQSTQTGITQSTMDTQNVPMYLNASSDLDFRSLEIWEDNVKVYDGHAAFDGTNYGVYDSISGTFTTQTYGGNTMIGGIVHNYLCFTAEQAISTVAITPATGITLTLYKSTDGTNFTSWDGSAVTLSNVGDKLYVYGNNQTLVNIPNENYYTYFTMTGRIAASGDATYLFQNGGLTTLPNDYAMTRLFYECTSLTTAPELPATTLTEYCYSNMFYGCTNLTTGPTSLPATTLQEYCYTSMFRGCTSLVTVPTIGATTLADESCQFMFYNCTSLTTAPTLSATTVGQSCYRSMFEGCTSLTTAPLTLPATTLASNCYAYMFKGCTSLATAPTLPATTLAIQCYHEMFHSCSNLNSVTCLATNISAYECTVEWVKNVSATGTFTKDASMSSWTTGYDGIPSGWTVVDAQ